MSRMAGFISGVSGGRRYIALGMAVYLLLVVLLGWWWSSEPGLVQLEDVVQRHAQVQLDEAPVGVATTASLVEIATVLLDKPGGYLTNDIFPPGVWLDNMPSWEFGVLVQLRDLSRVMRKDLSRSQSQSQEDVSLKIEIGRAHV